MALNILHLQLQTFHFLSGFATLKDEEN